MSKNRINQNGRILIIGHHDAIENSLSQYFQSKKYKNVFSSSSIKVDLLNQNSVLTFFEKNRPEYIFLGSFRSGGIAANQKFAAEFLYENLESQNNVIHAAYKSGIKKLIYFTGSCTYPGACPQPMKEDYLLTGPLEKTSEPYSIAKIAGTKLCQTYANKYGFPAIVAVPATIYGPGSDMDLETAHVMGALIGKFYEAAKRQDSQVVVWGSGKPRREFLYTEDFVNACLFLLEKYDRTDMINMGCGYDVSIKELALLLKEISGFKGKILFDSSKPDGTIKKLMDNTRITKLGWKAKVDLKEGIAKTFQWYKNQKTTGALK